MRRSTITITAALGALLLTTPGALAAVPVGGAWSGTTSQTDSQGAHGTIAFKVNKAANKASRFEWQERATCDSGQTFSSTNTTARFKISKRGRIASAGTFNGSAGEGFTSQHGASINGRFTSKRRFKGTFEDIVLIYDSSGKLVDTCRTGTVKITAKRNG